MCQASSPALMWGGGERTVWTCEGAWKLDSLDWIDTDDSMEVGYTETDGDHYTDEIVLMYQ